MGQDRKPQVLRQSPGLIAKTDRPGPSYLTQLNAAVNKKEEPEIYKVLAAEPGDHAHHKVILETLDRLFDNLNETDQAALREHIVNTHNIGIGNHIRNLINMPGSTHQGGIHTYAREMGYEIDAKNNPKGLALDILEAASVPDVRYRQHVADQYINEAVPALNEKINELLTEYYEQKSQPKRMAGEALSELMQGSTRTDSPGTNRERALVINSQGGDVTIGGGVLRSSGNGKGNGQH